MCDCSGCFSTFVGNSSHFFPFKYASLLSMSKVVLWVFSVWLSVPFFLQMPSSFPCGVYRVVLKARSLGDDDASEDNSIKLCKVFNLFIPAVDFELRRLLGCRWLQVARQISYDELFSHFITVCYDVLLDLDLVHLLVSSFVFPTVCNWELVSAALDSYQFDMGSFPYGGFLPRHELLANGWSSHLLH